MNLGIETKRISFAFRGPFSMTGINCYGLTKQLKIQLYSAIELNQEGRKHFNMLKESKIHSVLPKKKTAIKCDCTAPGSLSLQETRFL